MNPCSIVHPKDMKPSFRIGRETRSVASCDPFVTNKLYRDLFVYFVKSGAPNVTANCHLLFCTKGSWYLRNPNAWKPRLSSIYRCRKSDPVSSAIRIVPAIIPTDSNDASAIDRTASKDIVGPGHFTVPRSP